MARPRTLHIASKQRAARLARAWVAFGLLTASFALLPASMAAAASSIGVFVDQPVTTLPTPTTAPPATTPPDTTPPATTPPDTAPATTTPATTPPSTVPTTQPVTTVAPTTLPNVLPPQQTVVEDTGFVANVKSATKATKKVVSDVISGKPVADAIEAVLPQNVADVVVPAVRTASTFVFPIGLAGSVIAFLALQNRIDASDPKLSAAPLAHDDDVVKFL